MTSLSVLKKCLEAAIKNSDAEAVADILSKNKNLLNHFDNATEVVEFLLLEATSCENEEIIKLLFQFIQSGYKTCNNYKKRLKIAMSDGNLRLAEYSLRNGAKLEGADDLKKTDLPEFYLKSVLEKTNKSVRKEMLTLFIQYGRLDTGSLNDEGKSLLHLLGALVDKDDCDAARIAEILLDCGVLLDEPDSTGFTPLNYAIRSKNTLLVSLLVKKGADVNRKIDSGLSYFVGVFPLLMAAKDDNEDLVDVLVTHGADVNAHNSFGWTALHQACAYNWAKVINLLLKRGANVSPVDLYGRTPLSVIIPFRFNPQHTVEEQCSIIGMIIMVKEFAKLSMEDWLRQDFSVHRLDLDLIQVYPIARAHFEKCWNELNQMLITEFYVPYTFYSLLQMSKSNKKLAQLTKNAEIVAKFEANLSRFPYYEYDLQRIFNEAIRVRDRRLVIESELKSEFGNKFVII